MQRPPNTYCVNCDRDKVSCDKLRRCAKCKRAHYCSKACQVKHWKRVHKNTCVKKYMDGMTQHNPAHNDDSRGPLALPKSLLNRDTFTDFFLRSVRMQSDGILVPKVVCEVIYSFLTGYRTTFQVLDLKVEWFHCHKMAAHRKYELTRRGWNSKHIAENGHRFSLTRDSIKDMLGDIIEVLQTSPCTAMMCTALVVNCGATRFDAVKSRFTPEHYAELLRCVSRYVGYDPLQLNSVGISWSVTADLQLRRAILNAVKAKNKRKIELSEDFWKPSKNIDPKYDVETLRCMQDLEQQVMGSMECPIDWGKMRTLFASSFPFNDF